MDERWDTRFSPQSHSPPRRSSSLPVADDHGSAFAAGYLLHLPGDIVPAYLATGELRVGTLLWPLTDGGGSQGESFVRKVLGNVVPYVRELAAAILSGDLSRGLVVFLSLWALAFALWVYDGMPVVRDSYEWLRRAIGRQL